MILWAFQITEVRFKMRLERRWIIWTRSSNPKEAVTTKPKNWNQIVNNCRYLAAVPETQTNPQQGDGEAGSWECDGGQEASKSIQNNLP